MGGLARLNVKNAFTKHTVEAHGANNDAKNFEMTQISAHHDNLTRYITEAMYVEAASKDSLLNSKGEWGRGRLVRRTAEILVT